MSSEAGHVLNRIRLLIAIVIAGLVVSGLTAFPLVHEVDLLQTWLRTHSAPTNVTVWIDVIALFFFGPLIDPVRNVWVIRAGQIACVLVVPLAVICGEIRGIPLWWRGIDCAFGIVGFVPLWFADRLVRGVEAANRVAAQLGAIK